MRNSLIYQIAVAQTSPENVFIKKTRQGRKLLIRDTPGKGTKK